MCVFPYKLIEIDLFLGILINFQFYLIISVIGDLATKMVKKLFQYSTYVPIQHMVTVLITFQLVKITMYSSSIFSNKMLLNVEAFFNT